MKSLKKINVASETSKAASKSGVPVFNVVNPNIARYIAAHAKAKEAEAILKEVKTEIEELGLTKLYQHNTINNGDPASSVKLAAEEGTVMVTLQNRYSQANEDAAVSLFDNLGTDPNESVHFVTKTAFSDDVFLKNGEFQGDVFAAFKAGVEELAKKLNIASPLTTKVVVAPKEDFHARRWTKFTAEQQGQIQAVLKATVAVNPV